MQRVLIEACVDSLSGALAAERAGANRIELCGAGVGGTTPSHGIMTRCRELVQVPIHVMIRAREGNFVYSDDECEVMVRDIGFARAAGANGVVFGILHSNGTLDTHRMARLIDAARPLRVACHRAFDATPVPSDALHTLLSLGVDVVLTSGHGATALDGAAQLAQHCVQAGDSLEVMAGGNVRAQNVIEIVRETGVRALHVRATDSAVFADAVSRLRQQQANDPLSLTRE